MRFFRCGKFSFLMFPIFVFLITLLICISVFLPRNIGNIYELDVEATTVLGAVDVVSAINCDIDESGNYTAINGDPQLHFNVEGKFIDCVELNLASPTEEPVCFEVYTAYSAGEYSSEKCYAGSVFAGNTGCVVDLPDDTYSFLRVDVDTDSTTINNLSLYDKKPSAVPFVPERTVFDYLLALIIPLIATAIAYLLERQFNIGKKSICFFKANARKIAATVVIAAVCCLLAFLIELIVSAFLVEGSLNIYRFIFIAGALGLLSVFVFGYKSLKNKPENIFLPIILILGCVMLFVSPIQHICWDLDSHYYWAVDMSYMDTVYVTSADQLVESSRETIMVSDDHNPELYQKELNDFNTLGTILFEERDALFSLPHIPSGIFIAVARFFGADFAVRYNMGRLASLLVYAAVCYLAIRRLKSGKMIMSVIALFPTCIFLATNYSYDFWVTGFSLLGVAYFVSELQQPDKPITVLDTVIMCGAFVLASLPKLVYILLLGLPLFMHKNWIDKKARRRYYFILISILAILLIAFMLKSLTAVTGSGDSRGGDVDPAAQLAGIISNPLGYAKVLINFLLDYLSIGSTKQYISYLAYLGIGSCWPIMLILLTTASVTDANNQISFKIPVLVKLCAIALYFGLAAIIATVLYIDFTPVGADTILGCQARYLIPLLAPVALTICGKRINCVKNKSVYNGFILFAASATVMAEIYSKILVLMV